MKPNVQIYSKSFCPYCVRAKSFFEERGISFEEIDLSDRPQELEELKSRTGLRTVPQIFINGQLIGGYTDLVAAHEGGTLKDVLP